MKLSSDRRPVIVALAGPNGAGKTTFYHAHLKSSALRFLNADIIGKELGINPYAAADICAALRDELVKQRESFVFETVFSDPVGDKLEFLKQTAAAGYNVILCFVGIASARTCEERVAMRVSQSGGDVPKQKLRARFPRIIKNLKAAIRELPHVQIFDNGNLGIPFRRVAVFENGCLVFVKKPVPRWLKPLIKPG